MLYYRHADGRAGMRADRRWWLVGRFCFEYSFRCLVIPIKMADIGGVTPERVKNLLSSFLSGISKLSGQSSISRFVYDYVRCETE